VVEVFCSVYAQIVPPDGLEEVYRLHERARDGLPHLEPHPHSHPHPHPEPAEPAKQEAEAPDAGRPRRRTSRAREASG
jgi:hypothetical protein